VAVANPALAGVSGTQVISAADAQASGIHPETMALILNGERIPLTKRVTSLGRSRSGTSSSPIRTSAASTARSATSDTTTFDRPQLDEWGVGQRAPCDRHALANGDVITMGATDLRVEVS